MAFSLVSDLVVSYTQASFPKGDLVRKPVQVRFLLVCLFIASVFVLGSRHGAAQTPNTVAPVIASGLDAYKAKGPEEAVKAWLKGSPLEGSKEALTQANSLRQIQDYYGAFIGYDIFSVWNISPTTQVQYLALNYESGPVFAKFLIYKKQQGWVLISFSFNTKEDAILPTHLSDR